MAVLASASALACGGGPSLSGPEGTVFLLIVLAVVVLVPLGAVITAFWLAVTGARAVKRAIENAQDEQAKGLYVSRDWRPKAE